MTGASVEATLGLWASSLGDVKARMRLLFTRKRGAVSAGRFLDGLLGEERRRTGWMRAEAAGDAGLWRQLAGKIANCQIGVFTSYVSRHGHAFLDRALYLPKVWTEDAERMAAAQVPATTRFAPKPTRALAMIERAMTSNVPFSWVAADSVYGVGDLEMALKRAAKSSVLGVNANHPFRAHGANRWPLPGRQRTSLRPCPELPGCACRQALEPKARESMIGPISNWPISMPVILMRRSPAYGHADG